FFLQAEDGIRDFHVTGVQTCALPIYDDRDALPRYDYTLQSRVDDLQALLEHLGIDGPLTLAVHDWGGMIGFGWALERMPRVRRLVVLNTAAFPMPAGKPMPWQIALGRDYNIGELVIRGFNAFSARS